MHLFDYLATVSGVGLSPTRAKLSLRLCKVVFLGGSPVFAPPTDWPISYELK